MAFNDPIYIELGFISDETVAQNPAGSPLYSSIDPPPGNHSEVFGVNIITTINLGTVVDTQEQPAQGPGSGPDWIEPPGGWPPAQWVYGLTVMPAQTTINLGAVGPYAGNFPPGFDGMYNVGVFQRRPITYYRIQADGGGRQVMYAAYGDDSPRRFFELWKDGIRFSFLGLPDPVMQIRSPSGLVTTRTVQMRGRAYGRFSCDFGELNEIGDWKVQLRFIEEADSLGIFADDYVSPPPNTPGAPFEPGPRELWRALHKPLILRVCAGAEEIW